MITPHIGKKQAVEIAKEIGQTFENLTKTIEIHSRALPSSLANELLSEGLNNSLDLYSFLSTLNNPASLFIYSLPNETIKHNNELQI